MSVNRARWVLIIIVVRICHTYIAACCVYIIAIASKFQAIWTGVQLWCWARWAVGIQGGTSTGPAGLECSCGAGPGGLSRYTGRY